MTVRELELAVERMLEEANSPSPDNAMSVVELRTNVSELLEDLGERFARSPERRAQAHWRLWIMDVDDEAPATVAVAVVRAEGVLLGAGQAPSEALQAFEESGTTARPEEIFEALAARVTFAPTRIDAPTLTANAWASFE